MAANATPRLRSKAADRATALVVAFPRNPRACGPYSLVSVRAAALRVQDIITRIGETEDLHEAIALNTYARAELARLVAIRTRIKAARTEPLSAEQIALAAAQAVERQYMDFSQEDLR